MNNETTLKMAISKKEQLKRNILGHLNKNKGQEFSASELSELFRWFNNEFYSIDLAYVVVSGFRKEVDSVVKWRKQGRVFKYWIDK